VATYVSGNGGYIYASTDGFTYRQIHVGTWTLTRSARLAENTHSGTQGSSSYVRAVRDNSWRLEFPWDEDSEALYEDLIAADFLHVKFKYGASDLEVELAYTTLETAEVVDNNASDIVRAVLAGRGGRIL
jgi:hypothetical protein